MYNRALRYFVLCLFLSLITSCSSYHKVIRKPQIYDGKKFGRLALSEPEKDPFIFNKTKENIQLPQLANWANQKEIKEFADSEEFIANSETTAFIIIRNDSIIFENYYNGASESSTSQLFSITKPLIVSLLMQAKEEGKITSFDDKVDQYYPIAKHNHNCEELTLRHLANMQSGYNHYDYFRIFKISKLYHAKNVDKYIQRARVSRAPGGKFKYKSFDTQVLGTCLERIFDEENLLERFTNLYWKNIRPEHKGFFNVDSKKNNNMKYYGGLNISARDLAKIGRLYLNDGKFDDKQIISKEWLNNVMDTTNHVGKWDYNMGWYFDEYGGSERPIFYASGFNGQFLLLNKATNTIVIRIGKSKSKHEWFHILADLSTKL